MGQSRGQERAPDKTQVSRYAAGRRKCRRDIRRGQEIQEGAEMREGDGAEEGAR
jgi:hypothetical protein